MDLSFLSLIFRISAENMLNVCQKVGLESISGGNFSVPRAAVSRPTLQDAYRSTEFAGGVASCVASPAARWPAGCALLVRRLISSQLAGGAQLAAQLPVRARSTRSNLEAALHMAVRPSALPAWP